MTDLHKVGNYVVEPGDERPHSPSGKCFYCGAPIGGKHLETCLVPQKLVRVRFTIEIDVAQPVVFDTAATEFMFNEGSWCGNNVINLLHGTALRLQKVGRCLCDSVRAEVILIRDGGE